MDRQPGLSVRLKLILSYAGFLMLAGALLLTAVWVFLLRYVPDAPFRVPGQLILTGPSRDYLHPSSSSTRSNHPASGVADDQLGDASRLSG